MTSTPRFEVSITEDGRNLQVSFSEPEWDRKEDFVALAPQLHERLDRFVGHPLTQVTIDALTRSVHSYLVNEVMCRRLFLYLGKWNTEAGMALVAREPRRTAMTAAVKERMKELPPIIKKENPDVLLGVAGDFRVLQNGDAIVLDGTEREWLDWEGVEALHKILGEALKNRSKG